MTRRTQPFATLAPLFAALVAFGPAVAQAQQAPATAGDSASEASPALSEVELQEAARRYDFGLKLYSEGEFRLAVIEFERTYQITSDYRVLYNIGQVRIQLGNYARAIRSLEEYLKHGGDQIAPDRRAAVEADLEMLATRTGTVRIETNVPGADVFVDDLMVGTSPLPEPLLLDAGEHKITARKPGYDARGGRQVTLAGRDSLEVRVELQKIPDRGPSRIVVERHVPAERDSTMMWATWSATGVFAIAAGVTGGLGIKAASDLADLRRDPSATRGELDSSARRSRTLLLTSDVLGGVAIASGGLALYFTLTDPAPADDKPAKTKTSPPRTGVVLGTDRILVHGSF